MKHYYVDEKHSELPHIVKFSGGRSSGMLVFKMLENGMLNAERGDVILFNNTSAEDIETYKFVVRCKEECEKKYDIPFFMIEFQTYEDSQKGIYDRYSTYKLVNDKPYSEDNPDGYHHNGEVFEEYISWKAHLPSTLKRTCTREMKMNITHNFLKDWFSTKTEIGRKGHFGKTPRVDWDDLYAKHKKYGGGVPEDIFFAKKCFTYEGLHFRKNQILQDFTTVNIDELKSKMTYTESAFCSFIGFRSDEPARITKMKKRIGDEFNDNFDVAYVRDENEEHVYAPLVEFNFSEKDVKEFWNNQEWDLALPSGGTMSNCVYCFMKGTKKLVELAKQEEPYEGDPTPKNLQWWINIEEKYQRDLVAENRTRTNSNNTDRYMNFFELGGMSYSKIKELSNKKDDDPDLDDDSLPCNCSD